MSRLKLKFWLHIIHTTMQIFFPLPGYTYASCKSCRSNIYLVSICVEIVDEYNVLDPSLGFSILSLSEHDRFLFHLIYNLSLQDTVVLQTTLIYRWLWSEDVIDAVTEIGDIGKLFSFETFLGELHCCT